MDANNVEKVNELAKSLKNNHLAASMEDAVEQAKKILNLSEGDNTMSGEEKAVKEMIKQEESSAEGVEEEQKELEEIKEEVNEKIEQDNAEIEESQEIIEDLKKEKEDLASAEEALEIAEGPVKEEE